VIKKLLIRILLRLITSPSRRVVEVGGVELRVGQTPSNVKIDTWDYNHDGKRAHRLDVWYKDINTHDEIPCSSLEDAIAKYRIVEQQLGKKVGGADGSELSVL
jgi:hypothetical protein